MDKKLSDNEIVKALDNDCLCVVYGVDCESCPLREKDCKILPEAIKDLIHRLQDENEQLKSTKHRASWKAKFFKAQAEIERLTKLVDKWENVYGDDYWLAKHNEILKEILEAVDKESNGQTLSVTNVLRKRYGVEVE